MATRWSSRTSFIFAAAAAAVGLGNIWWFPYILGQNGGGAFVVIYIGCVLMLGIPLLVAEVVIGRIGRKNPIFSITDIARQSNRSRLWGWVGAVNILAGFLILSYYVVIVGWVLDYLVRAVISEMSRLTETSALQKFKNLQSSHWQMLTTDTMVLLGAIGIIFCGVKQGLERAVMIMFPGLLLLLLMLLGYAMTTGQFIPAIIYLFKPELHELTARTVLLAMGQAFFSLNVAMGITMMFSAYLPKHIPLMSSVIAITMVDTGIALLSGMVIFPVVFAYHLQPGAGPSLIFHTLPLAFSHIPLGRISAVLFFLMLFLAAFTSVIAMLEPSVRWLMERFHISRHKAVCYAGSICWVLSFGTIASFSQGNHFQIFGVSFFKAIDSLTADIMLPIGGLLIALFTGWCLSPKLVSSELAWDINGHWFRIWLFLLRYIAPIFILLILFSAL